MSTQETSSHDRAEPERVPTVALSRLRDTLRNVEQALEGLRYGTVTLVVQDGVVVQVERLDRIRLDAHSRRAG